jgi:hypothetical protein
MNNVQKHNNFINISQSQTFRTEYGQLYIFDSAEVTTKRLENQSDQRRVAAVLQRRTEALRQVNSIC